MGYIVKSIGAGVKAFVADGIEATSARSAWLSLGANVHPDYGGGSPYDNPYLADSHQFYRNGYGYDNASLVGQPNPQPGWRDIALNLGIKRFRTGAKPWPDFGPGSFGVFQLLEMSDLGFAADGERLKWSLIIGPANGPANNDSGWIQRCVNGVNAVMIRSSPGDSASPYVDRVSIMEGPNEPDIFGGINLTRNAIIEIAGYRDTMPDLKRFPFVSASIVNRNNFDTVGDVSAYVDGGNGHPYAGGFKTSTNLSDVRTRTNVNTRNKGIYVATECNFHTAFAYTGGRQWGVPESVQAHYTLITYMEMLRLGATETYIYELLDQYYDDPAGTGVNADENNFGIVRYAPDAITNRPNFTVKPAYTAVQNLVAQVKDLNSNYTPSTFPVGLLTTVGGNDDVRYKLHHRSDGKKLLYLWRDGPLWDHDGKTLITPTSINKTIVFNGTPSLIRTNQPSVNTTYSNVTPATSITVSVDQRLTCVEITP